MKCRACDIEKDRTGRQWWNLSGYFGITGSFCPDCYDKVSHDSYQQPCNPGEYTKILLKLSGERDA